MTPDLAITLDAVARAAARLRSDWWIIGSAAAALLGSDETPADVDVLCDEADARRLCAAMGGEPLPVGGSELFRSVFLARVSSTPLPIEIMASLDLNAASGWTSVRPRTRLPAGGLFVPDAAEQAQICRQFGRPKDLARAARLDALAKA